MKVKLVKTEVAEFNLPYDNCERISHELFRSLINFECKEEKSNEPKMVVFKSKEEYLENACKYDLDLNQSILINPKGQIFCWLKKEGDMGILNQNNIKNDTTNTAENTGE